MEKHVEFLQNSQLKNTTEQWQKHIQSSVKINKSRDNTEYINKRDSNHTCKLKCIIGELCDERPQKIKNPNQEQCKVSASVKNLITFSSI